MICQGLDFKKNLGHNSHTQIIHLKCTVQCFRYLTPEHFIPLKETSYSLAVTPLSRSLVTTTLLSVSMNLPILDLSYKLNHSICDLESGIFHLA